MTKMIRPSNLIEPAIVPDTFITGALEVDKLSGGNVQLVLYTAHHSLHDGSLERVVSSRIVASRADLMRIALGIVRELTDNAPAETVSATLDCLEEGSRH